MTIQTRKFKSKGIQLGLFKSLGITFFAVIVVSMGFARDLYAQTQQPDLVSANDQAQIVVDRLHRFMEMSSINSDIEYEASVNAIYFRNLMIKESPTLVAGDLAAVFKKFMDQTKIFQEFAKRIQEIKDANPGVLFQLVWRISPDYINKVQAERKRFLIELFDRVEKEAKKNLGFLQLGKIMRNPQRSKELKEIELPYLIKAMPNFKQQLQAAPDKIF